MYIGIDFDGTCVTHAFPKIGLDIGAIPVLKELVSEGHQLVLNTMRDDVYLQDAVDWFAFNNIPLFGVNENPTQKSWTSSPKVFADMYIDDAALGCPLKFDAKMSNRPFVDWAKVREYLLGAVTIPMPVTIVSKALT
jgi:hypothetical protein